MIHVWVSEIGFVEKSLGLRCVEIIGELFTDDFNTIPFFILIPRHSRMFLLSHYQQNDAPKRANATFARA